MSLRSPRERALQTLLFEVGGLLLVAPLYALVFSAPMEESFLIIAALAVAVMIWSPIHNTIFDVLDLRMTGRVASDRPHGLRIIHAVSHESTSLVVTVPLLIWLGGHSLMEAILLDIGLTIVFAIYAYVFNIIYDRLRPVRPFGQER